MYQSSGPFGQEVEVPLPDDFNIHLRQGVPLATYTRDATLAFGRVLVMPSTNPPIRTARQAQKYCDRIVSAARGTHGFTPLMSFYIDGEHSEDEVRSLADAGVIAGKLHLQGAERSGALGVADIEDAYASLEVMESLGMTLCVHGEDPDAFVLEREQAFLPTLEKLAKRFPRLRIVLEHISSATAVRMVRELPETVGATITAHHLAFTLDDVIGDAVRPHNYCTPVPKRPEDRSALREAAFSGESRFFFGSDSIPHPIGSKEKREGCPGVYSAPTAVPVLLSLFEQHSNLDSFVAFVARNGARFHDFSYTDVAVRYTRRPWSVAERYSNVVPFASGQTLEWYLTDRVRVEGPAEAEVRR